jgi:hypothetical protein
MDPNNLPPQIPPQPPYSGNAPNYPNQGPAPVNIPPSYNVPPAYQPPPQPPIPQDIYAPPPQQRPVYPQPSATSPSIASVQAPAALPAAKTNPNSTQNTLQVAEVRDGIVIMNDGSFRSVVMVKSINFDLMSPQEREAVEYAYQGFLNSLYFPVQIFIRSQKVDLTPYIEKLDKIRSEHENMLLALLMEDYIAYIDNLSLQTNIMDKKFYIVIPFFPNTSINIKSTIGASKSLFTGVAGIFKNKEQHVVVNEAVLEAGKNELRNRVQSVLSGLLQCGIQGLPLDTQELIELYYDTYNPDTATRQQLKNFEDLDAPVITKGQGAAPQPNLERELQ